MALKWRRSSRVGIHMVLPIGLTCTKMQHCGLARWTFGRDLAEHITFGRDES